MAEKSSNKSRRWTIHSPFACRLRQLRIDANMKQEDVAKLLAIHRTAYTKYETDRAAPDLDGLRTLAKLYNVSLDYLIDGDTTAHTPAAVVQDGTAEPLQLDAQELTLVTLFRHLTTEQRSRMVQTVYDEAKKNNV